jgi:oxygen-independent coproporphyrinogen III oxidase
MAMPFPILSDDLIRRLDQPGPRYTSYPTVPEWSEAFGPDDHGAALERAARTPDRPLSLYVHIPFCREMCWYCGCNVIVTRDPAKRDQYLDVLAREVALVADRLGERRRVARLHLGGGTPTSLDETQLARLSAILADRFDLLPGAEVAIEIDPAVTSVDQLALLRALGWNRLSMGVQDFDPDVQRAVNRIQSPHETRALIEAARGMGWESINLDLIYGLPFQREETWRRTIDEILSIRPDRIAIFSFAYVPTAKPHQRRLPVAGMPQGPAKLALLRLAHDALTGAGYLAIGMDHFALPGDELARAQRDGTLWRDFQGYTTLRAGDTIGLGLSSISDVGGAYVQNEKVLSRWQQAIEAGRLPTERGILRTADDERRRALITDLMCNFSVDLGDDAVRWAQEVDSLRPLVREGLCVIDGRHVAVTPLGRPFVRNLAMKFDAYLGQNTAQRPVFSRTV